jgi:hypothetical protein
MWDPGAHRDASLHLVMIGLFLIALVSLALLYPFLSPELPSISSEEGAASVRYIVPR